MDFSKNQVRDFFKKTNTTHLLTAGQWGIERETHRMNSDGTIALTPQPDAFIDPKIQKYITVDFGENQLEFITKPYEELDSLFDELDCIHKYAYQHINGELMWPFSMPPRLPEEEIIPLAEFPYLEDGLEKEVYRRGLAVRYGKKLQMISGIHYNYSLDDQLIDLLHQEFAPEQSRQSFVNQLYLKIGRNMLRYRWLLVYLYGAAPVIDSSYDSVIEDKINNNQSDWLAQFFDRDDFLKYVTSYRTSRFGYSTEVEDKYQVSYDTLEGYIADLRKILSTENENYRKIGTEKDGKIIQLNTNELQIEAEFYAPVRFRQIQKDGETLLDALDKRGISYFELRIHDLNPFSKVGITKEQVQFTHLMILMSLFDECDGLSDEQQIFTNQNHQLVALFGRKPGLNLYLDNGEKIEMKAWANSIFEKITRLATFIDQDNGNTYYADLVAAERQKLDDPSAILSERIMAELDDDPDAFLKLGLRLAEDYQVAYDEN